MPPSITSAPSLTPKVSSPSPPERLLSPESPRRTSFPDVPRRFSIFSNEREFAPVSWLAVPSEMSACTGFMTRSNDRVSWPSPPSILVASPGKITSSPADPVTVSSPSPPSMTVAPASSDDVASPPETEVATSPICGTSTRLTLASSAFETPLNTTFSPVGKMMNALPDASCCTSAINSLRLSMPSPSSAR